MILSVKQILAGVYPVAQVREPYSAIAYLGQRLNLPMLLRLQHPEYNTQQQDLGESEWSAMDICEGNQQIFEHCKALTFIYINIVTDLIWKKIMCKHSRIFEHSLVRTAEAAPLIFLTNSDAGCEQRHRNSFNPF